MSDSFPFGIEEEYFVNDCEKRNVARSGLHEFFTRCREHFPKEIQREMLEPQLEVATAPCENFSDARRSLADLRRDISNLAAGMNLSIVAAGTHPNAMWSRIRATAQSRYDKLIHDLQMVGSRNMICGMHVHVEVPDPALRVDVMNRVQPYLPLMFALSTSSPFWQAQKTGLLSYRLAANRELPRTGLPEFFNGLEDYQKYIDTLVGARAIADSSYVFWLVRPSLRYPTLELRIADSCTRLDDVMAIAALYRCLIRHLVHHPELNAELTGASHAIVEENCWRAQRYGIHGSFVDEATRSARMVKDVLDDVIAMLEDDADALQCRDELDLCRWIIARGTSADQQLNIFTEAMGRGLTKQDALSEVVDWLSSETAGSKIALQ